MIHALLVDDDPDLRALVSGYLGRYGMRVTAVADGASVFDALDEAGADPFDVLLLDLMLPDIHGLALCARVRQTSSLPIVMLTAQGDPASRIVGLEFGADDYLPKPFEPRELVARIQAVLRRSHPSALQGHGAAATTVRFNGWLFDRVRRELASPEGVRVTLSAAEFRLLTALVDHPRRVLSRERLLEMTRAPGVESTDRAVDLAVSRLRQKVGDAALIRTVRGEGYLFDADVGR